ncbi:HlyC/CorC family transporter [Candidatus Woesearchaeota archaeon]|nr:HlyC/CorC family transporter [Candidatus Woesearchaeota archaeon]
MISTWQIITLIILLFLSGFFSGAEVALISLSKHKVRKLISQRYAGAKYIKKLKDNPHRMLSTILLGNNAVNIGAAALTTSIAIRMFGHYAVGIATGIMTFLVLIFGEITPKSIATAHNEIVSRIVAPPIWYLSLIFSPILTVLEFMVSAIPKVFGISLKPKKMTEDDMIHLVKIAQEEGAILDSEEKLITNVLLFDNKKIKAVMTPRRKIVSLGSGLTISGAVKIFARTKFSRLPVYDEVKHQYIGVVYAKELIEHSDKGDESITSIMKPTLFVSGNMGLSRMFQLFKERHSQFALVLNEIGQVSGMITLEDLLEEIVGEIHDEMETVSEKIVKISDKKYLVEGDTELEKINAQFQVSLRQDGCNNIKDYVYHQLRKQRKAAFPGERIWISDLTIKLQEVDGENIDQLIIERR